MSNNKKLNLEVLPQGVSLKPYRLEVTSNGVQAIVEIQAISMLRAKLAVEQMFNSLSSCKFEGSI